MYKKISRTFKFTLLLTLDDQLLQVCQPISLLIQNTM